MLGHRSVPCTRHSAAHTAFTVAVPTSCRTAIARRQMLSGAGAFNQPRRGMSVSAMFGFKWPFGGSDEPSKTGNHYSTITPA